MTIEAGGTKEEREAAKISPAKRTLTTAQLNKALSENRLIYGLGGYDLGKKFKRNVIKKAKELGIKSEIALKRLAIKVIKAANKKGIVRRMLRGPEESSPVLSVPKPIRKNGGSVKKYAKGGGIRKVRYK